MSGTQEDLKSEDRRGQSDDEDSVKAKAVGQPPPASGLLRMKLICCRRKAVLNNIFSANVLVLEFECE